MHILSHNAHPALEHVRHIVFHMSIFVAATALMMSIYMCVGFMLWGALNISVFIFSVALAVVTIISALSIAKLIELETHNK